MAVANNGLVKRRGLYIIWLYADSPQEWNCSEWRAKIPSDALNASHEAGTSPHRGRLFQMATALNWKHPQVQKQLGLADVIVFQRNVLVPEVWDAMDHRIGFGIRVAGDNLVAMTARGKALIPKVTDWLKSIGVNLPVSVWVWSPANVPSRTVRKA